MNSNFPAYIAKRIVQSDIPLSDQLVVLPTRRAAAYVKKELLSTHQFAGWLPRFTTLNKLAEELSGLVAADHMELSAYCFEAYSAVLQGEAKSFSDFFSWSDILLKDFNDIDSQLVDPETLFKDLTNYSEIEHFSFLNTSLSEKQVQYRTFWNSLKGIYYDLQRILVEKKLGYPGLILKTAYQKAKAEHPLPYSLITVAGFNAFSKAEIELLKHYQEKGKATIIYDADAYYMENPVNHAGHFLRRNLKIKLGELALTKEALHLRNPKIELCEADHRVDQAQLLSGILDETPPDILKKTVLVLSDEKMLIPVLSKLPRSVDQANITMGLSLFHSLFKDWIEILFTVRFHTLKSQNKTVLSNKSLHNFFSHPFTVQLPHSILKEKLNRNGFTELAEIAALSSESSTSWVHAAYNFWKGNEPLSESLGNLLDKISLQIQTKSGIFHSQTDKGISVLKRTLNKIDGLARTQSLDANAYLRIFNNALSSSGIDLIGQTENSLQIMGLLETRALSFENVMICSVNEGDLPKSPNPDSFIPFEIRRHYGLPGKKEKEAVYAYNFYRLLQHCEKAQLIYHINKEDFSGGEKSRYIQQLIYDLQKENQASSIITRRLKKSAENVLVRNKQIEKTPEVIEAIKAHLKTGISISSINAYLSDPLNWFYSYILRLQEPPADGLSPAIFGNIVHKVLENLYKPFLGRVLTDGDILNMEALVIDELSVQFNLHPESREYSIGENKIQFETAKGMIFNFLKSEIKEIEKGDEIVVYDLEKDLTNSFVFQISGQEIPLTFKGFADRIDRRNGILHIYDYKTGNVDKTALSGSNWEAEAMKKKPKLIQLYAYYMLASSKFPNEDLVASIISLPKPRNRSLYLEFENGSDARKDFESFLKALLEEMLDPNFPIVKDEEYEYASFE